MPIYKTYNFWNYIVDESPFVLQRVKEILTHKSYNFDTKQNEYEIYWQEEYGPEIEGVQIKTLRYPAGLTDYLRSKINLQVIESGNPYYQYTDEEIKAIFEDAQKHNPDFEIRDYQIEMVKVPTTRFASLILSGVGSGKSSGMSLLIKLLKNNKVLVMNGNNFILQQINDRLVSFGETDISWNPSKDPDYTKRIVLINTKLSDSKLNKQDPDYINFLSEVNTLIVDECFDGNTEILTNFGWKKFKELNGTEKFANFKVETQEIYFTTGKLIKRLHHDNCIDLKTNKESHIIMTPNHQQLFLTSTNNIKKMAIKDMVLCGNRVFCSGKGIGKKEKLSNLDKILIAIQADGCAANGKNFSYYQIGFSKERKIQHWLEIIKDFKGTCIELKSDKRLKKERRRWRIWLPDYENKKAKYLYKCFNLEDFSENYSKEFIQEISIWDGWKHANTIGYDSTDELNVNFVAAVATLGGYSTYQVKKIDNRSPTFNDSYRLFMKEMEFKSTTSFKKKIIPYNDYVYCVEVPEHNIIVRGGENKKFTFISGNCHRMQALTGFEPIFYMDPTKLQHIVGYSGSPYRNHKNIYTTAEDFRLTALLGEPAFSYEMKDTVQKGTIAKPYAYFISYNNRKAFLPPGLEDNYFMQYRANIIYNKNRNAAGVEMLKFLHKNDIKTIASFNNIKPGQNIMKSLKEAGIPALFICGDETIYEWVYNKRGTLKLEKRSGTPDDIKKALSEDNYNIVIASQVLDEGVDIDIFQCAVLFSANKSNIGVLQRIGRASRKRKNGENVSLVVDFKDVGGHYIFQNHYNERKKLMIDSGIEVFEKVQDFIALVKEIGNGRGFK